MTPCLPSLRLHLQSQQRRNRHATTQRQYGRCQCVTRQHVINNALTVRAGKQCTLPGLMFSMRSTTVHPGSMHVTTWSGRQRRADGRVCPCRQTACKHSRALFSPAHAASQQQTKGVLTSCLTPHRPGVTAPATGLATTAAAATANRSHTQAVQQPHRQQQRQSHTAT